MTNYDPMHAFRLRVAEVRERRRLSRIPRALHWLFQKPRLWPWVERLRRRKD